MPLKNIQIQNARRKEKPYKLTDGEGLYLEVTPKGAKLWRLRYRLHGKESVFAIGSYPAVNLADARKERDRAKQLIKDGINPSHHRKLEKIRKQHEQANTFEAVAGEWLDRNVDKWTPGVYRQRERALKHDVYPFIGTLPMTRITPAHILDIITRLEKRAPTMAAIVNQIIGNIFRYAVVTLRADSDPSQPIKGVLKSRQTRHYKPLAAKEIPAFLEALDAYPGYYSNKVALRLLLLTLARTSEALEARWDEIDLTGAKWTIPAERMKMRRPHVIPLSTQAVELLKELHMVTGNGEYLFPNKVNFHRPASKGVLRKMIDGMGYGGRFTPHGIRATGSTILNEMGFRAEVIEAQLAHQERNKSRAAYNRAEYLDERREMMQSWADYLDSFAKGNVIPLHSKVTA